jgi:hypothetical protein
MKRKMIYRGDSITFLLPFSKKMITNFVNISDIINMNCITIYFIPAKLILSEKYKDY